MIQVAYAIIWWLILLVIGLIAFPLASRVCGRLLDKGYSISKNPKGRVPLDRLPSYPNRFAFYVGAEKRIFYSVKTK